MSSSDSDMPRKHGAGDDLGDLLLRHADRSFAPPQAAESSVWRGVESALAVGSLAPTPLAAPAPAETAVSLAPQKVALALSWKAALGVAAIGLAGSVALYVRHAAPTPAPDPVASAVPASSLAVSPMLLAPDTAAALSQDPPALLVAPESPRAAKAGVAAAPPPASTGMPLADAEKLLEARRAIRTGDTARALSLLATVSARGPLAEERDVLTIEALAPANGPRAKKLAAQFLDQHPQSPYRGRAEAVLAR